MDLSKLPRFSQTKRDDAPTPVAREAADAPTPPAADQLPIPSYSTAAPAADAASAWISIAVGVILLLLSPRLFQYLFSPETFGAKWKFNDAAGQPLSYPQTVFIWGDLCLVAFAVVMIVEGIVLAFAGRRWMVMGAFGLTVLATLANLIYSVLMLQQGYGPQIMSLLAVAFGVYIAIGQWSMLQLHRLRG